jgi:hypothetical protein
MGFTDIVIPYLGHPIRLVDRDQLRFKLHGRMMAVPDHLPAIKAVPAPPTSFDWTKSRSLKFPILGNDHYGDCFYCWAAHQAQLYTGNSGIECAFDASAVIARYLKIAGGDNGLGDQDIFPEFTTGVVGPNGPRKILDVMTVKPSDSAAIAIGLYYFCGGGFTCSLPSGWANNAGPNAIWGTGGGRSVGGHAVMLSGKNAAGNYIVETWGIDPGIQMTPAGMLSVSPEVIICFSADMFDPITGLSPAKQTWDEARALWLSLGGKDVGPSPFAPPVVPLPIPKDPYRIVFGTDLPGGQLSITTGGLVIQAASSSPFTKGEYMVTHVDPLPPP